jgi:hypothetical protein
MSTARADRPMPLTILCTGPSGWRTYESDSIDDAIGLTGAILLLSQDNKISSKYLLNGKWHNEDFFVVHGMMRTVQGAVPMDPIHLQIAEQDVKDPSDAKKVEDDLRAMLGLSPANGDNTPNLPGDPRLFGEDDPFYYDYRPDGGRPAA